MKTWMNKRIERRKEKKNNENIKCENNDINNSRKKLQKAKEIKYIHKWKKVLRFLEWKAIKRLKERRKQNKDKFNKY